MMSGQFHTLVMFFFLYKLYEKLYAEQYLRFSIKCMVLFLYEMIISCEAQEEASGSQHDGWSRCPHIDHTL